MLVHAVYLFMQYTCTCSRLVQRTGTDISFTSLRSDLFIEQYNEEHNIYTFLKLSVAITLLTSGFGSVGAEILLI